MHVFYALELFDNVLFVLCNIWIYNPIFSTSLSASNLRISVGVPTYVNVYKCILIFMVVYMKRSKKQRPATLWRAGICINDNIMSRFVLNVNKPFLLITHCADLNTTNCCFVSGATQNKYSVWILNVYASSAILCVFNWGKIGYVAYQQKLNMFHCINGVFNRAKVK